MSYSKTLPKVSLGRTGKQLSRFGLGGYHQVEISSEVVEQVIDTFLAEGGNYIETARVYGSGASEEKIGRALEGRRDQVILCSKSMAKTADAIRVHLEKSLALLRTDHIEFYYLHCVGPNELEQITAPGGAVEGLLKAKEEGLIDGVGLSSHHPPVYLEAFARIPLDLILIWCNYLDNLNFPIIPEQILPEALRRSIGITAMKPLADGFLYRSPTMAVRYCLGSQVEVAVCGANSPEQVRQIAEAVRQAPLDEAEQQQTLRDAPELGRYVCRRCGQCPAELMDTFRLEGEFDRQMIDFLPHDPADHALRRVLSGWFNLADASKAKFASAGYDGDKLISSASAVMCPYGIDVARKARLVIAKLTGADPKRV